MLGSLKGPLGPKLSIFVQFFNVFGWPLLCFLGRLWASLGTSWGHLGLSWALPGAISWPAWATLGFLGKLFGRPWGPLGAILLQLWARLGYPGVLLAFLVPCCAISRSLVSLFGRPWSLPAATLCLLGAPGVPIVPSSGHFEAFWGRFCIL